MRQLARPHLRQVVRERAVRHDDVNGRRLGAHAEQAHDVRVCELVHNLSLLDELALVRLVRSIVEYFSCNALTATSYLQRNRTHSKFYQAMQRMLLLSI